MCLFCPLKGNFTQTEAHSTDVQQFQRKYGKGNVISATCTSCGKEFSKKSASVEEIGTSLIYYADDSDLCDECEKITWYS
jgi:uncharacterized protein with PIN domain